MKTNMLLFAVLLLASSCSSLKNYNGSSSAKIVSEKTTLKITPVSARTDKNQAAGLAAVAATIGPSLIDFGVKSIQQKLKSDALKYTGSYKAFTSEEKFRTTEKDIALPKLKITREIVLEKDAVSGSTTPAVSFELIPIQSEDQTAFRYKLDNSTFSYNYSIAKLKGQQRFVDLTVEIKVKSLSVKSGEYKLNDVRTVSVNIPMVKVGKANITDDIYTGWIPLLPKSEFDEEKKGDVTETKITTKTEGAKPAVKTTEEVVTKDVVKKKPQPINASTGLYEIEVVVTEVNPAKIKAEQRAAFVDATSESGTAVLKSILEALTKDKDADEEKEAE